MRLFLFAALAVAITLHADAQQPTTPPKGKTDAKPKSDLELFQGNWHIVGLETSGKPEDPRNYRGNTFSFNKVTATLRERQPEDIEFAFKLDPDANPKSIDLILPTKNVTFRGIYKLESDDLTICVSNGGPRPTQFATKAGGDTETFTLKRDRWVQFTDADYGFTIEMPVKPEEKQRDLDTAAGMTSVKLLVARSEMERVTYVLAVARLPGKLNPKEADAAMTATRNLALAEAYPGARSREEKKNPPPKGPGMGGQEYEVVLDLPKTNDRAVARVRQSVAGERLFVLLAAGPGDAIRTENLARFWSSRQLLGKKGKN
jgi:uncharacterized protein (TIGR03067 family)